MSLTALNEFDTPDVYLLQKIYSEGSDKNASKDGRSVSKLVFFTLRSDIP